MKISAWIAAFLLACTLSLATVVHAQTTGPCALRQLASINLIVGEQVTVKVLLDGHPGLMELQTSSTLNLVWKELARRWKLPQENLDQVMIHYHRETVRKRVTGAPFSVDSVDFGKADFIVVSNSDKQRPPGDIPVIGALGSENLSRVDFELDLAHRKLNLFSPDHCPGHAVYWADEAATAPLYVGPLDELYGVMQLDGQNVQTSFATSSRETTMDLDVAMRLYGFDRSSPGVFREVIDGSTKHFRLMDITAPGLTMKRVKVHLLRTSGCAVRAHLGKERAAGFSGCKGVYPLSLGRDVLEKMRLYFSRKESLLYVTPADSGTSSPPQS